jgi:hypothetical protein
MVIEFKCHHCNNMVRAPDDAGGKMGRCPYCQNQVYIATPADQLEELDLAPVDAEDRAQQRALERETEELMERIRGDKAAPEDADVGSSGGADAGARGIADAGARRSTVEELVITYLAAMKNADLSGAEQVISRLAGSADEAKQAAERIAADPLPPADLADVPPNVMRGFIKQLLARL